MVGFFALAIKPLSVKSTSVSKTLAKKLTRISVFDEDTKSYNMSAYLIAQLGKNYSLLREKQIQGRVLLDFALKTIEDLKYSIGGILEFLECEENDFLLNFYKSNDFKPFDIRISSSSNATGHILHQLLRRI